MSNKSQRYIKIHTYYFFNDIINMKNFDPNNIKIDEKLYNNILVYCIVPTTNECKEKNEKYEKLWSKIRYLIRSATKNSVDYNEKYRKIKFNSDDELPLNKTIEILSMIVLVRAIFLENSLIHMFY